MIELLNRIEELELREAEAEEAGNEDLADELYTEKYRTAAEKAAAIIEKATNEIDHITAMRMVWHKREELKRIFA